MCPPFDERRGREQDRLARLGFDAPQVLVMEEVPRIDLVDRNRPQRRVVVVAQVLVLAFGRPRRIDVSEVVVRARRLRLERPRRPHTGKGPAVEVGRGRDGHQLARRQGDDRLPFEERGELFELLTADANELAGCRMLGLHARPHRQRIAAVHPARERAEGLLGRLQLARRDRQQPIDRHRQPFLEPQLLLEVVAAQAKRRTGPGRDLGFEVLHVRRDGVRRLGLGIGQVAEQMEIVDVGEGARQLLVDELQGAAHRLDADLDVDARRLLDVVARGLDETRRLAQLRQHAARALRRRSVGKQRLARKTRREEVRVVLRVALPGAHHLELEHPPLEMRDEHLVFEALDAGQRIAVDLVQAAQVPRQGVRFTLNRVAADVLEQVVMRVHAVQRRVRGMRLVQI